MPFYLRRLPDRGTRQVEMEVEQHYPHYVNPLVPTTRNPGYISEVHRLHPSLTVDDELRHERRAERERKEKVVQLRAQQRQEREAAIERQREEVFQREQQRLKALAGTNLKNRNSENRDVLTHQCQTKEAKEFVEYREALGKYKYYQRQYVQDVRTCPSGLNSVTWEPRPRVQVPPLPIPPWEKGVGRKEGCEGYAQR